MLPSIQELTLAPGRGGEPHGDCGGGGGGVLVNGNPERLDDHYGEGFGGGGGIRRDSIGNDGVVIIYK